ncbi:MAG: BamA/TamA family outer membrane protein [Bacteroidales bacterium]|nr:BamA/TamA family outer membrane protein [Bacteroidales bacterium]
MQSYELSIDNKNVKKERLTPFVRQKPNKTILGFRFHLWLYNKSKLDKDNKWNKWLRRNGEEPVIWSQSLTNRSRDQLNLSLRNQGYYYAHVTDSIAFKKKKAYVYYRVKTGDPYIVHKISYSIPDTAIARLIIKDTVNTLLHSGMLLDADVLEKERKRVETRLKENGYFSFSKDYIGFLSDTTFQNKTVNIEMNVRPHTEQTTDNRLIETSYPRYQIRSLTVNAGLSMQNLLTDFAKTPIADTVNMGSVQYIMPEHFPVKASTISQSLYINPGNLYKLSDVDQTYQHLQSLRNFNRISTDFAEVPDQNGLMMRDLDCRVNLLPLKKYSYTAELEGTNSDGNFGGGVNLLFQNKSLFGHAEIFDFHLRGTIEAVSATNAVFKFKHAMELETEMTLNLPKFLLPFQHHRFTRQYSPKTVFSLLYNYQQRPQYTRTIFNTSVGYNWRGSSIISHTVRPVEINYVQLDQMSSEFTKYLNKYPYLKNSYQTHMVVSSNYTFTRDLPSIKKDNFFFIRSNFETAGLLLNSFFKLKEKNKTETATPYMIFDNPFSQFVKVDVDLRYYQTLNANNHVVTRLFAGVGLPYGNSKVVAPDGTVTAAMPFEKKYYSGGTLSMRGWRMRSLGPGSYKDSVTVSAYPNNTGDVKLEANIEYRFKLVWVIEGALFVDVGNVWDLQKDEKRAGADFEFKRFYRELAVDAGLGFRLDFTYFILSIDTGMKLIDPAGSRGWIFNSLSDTDRPRIFNVSFGIGYPF